jgi:hypothetical protein
VRAYVLRIMPIFFALGCQPAVAQDDPTLNYREKCRRIASGAYADAVGDKYQAEDVIILAENARKKSKAIIENHEAKLRLVNKQLQSNDYDAKLLEERDTISSQIKLFHEQLLTSEGQLESARKKLGSVKKHHDSLKLKVEKIFTVTFSEDPDGGPRKIFSTIDWKSPCPKYRSLCPLPPADAKVLASLLDDINDQDLSCFKYSKLK